MSGMVVEEGRKSRWDKLPPCTTRCKTYLIQVKTEQIGYVNAILESYDYVARIKTNDIKRGVLEIQVPEDSEDVFLGAAHQLARELDLKFLSDEEI